LKGEEGVRAFEEERHRDIQHSREFEQLRRTDAIGAALVLPDLLEAHAHRGTDAALAHAKKGAPLAQEHSDMDVDGMKFRHSVPGLASRGRCDRHDAQRRWNGLPGVKFPFTRPIVRHDGRRRALPSMIVGAASRSIGVRRVARHFLVPQLERATVATRCYHTTHRGHEGARPQPIEIGPAA
jgi:hypothetical protein